MSGAHPVVLKTHGFAILWDGISYVIRKPGDEAGRELSYCTTLETALEMMFRKMVVQRIKAAKDYGATVEELKQVIIEVRRDFTNLVIMPDDISKMAQRVGDRAKTDPLAYEQPSEVEFRVSLRRETGDKKP